MRLREYINNEIFSIKEMTLDKFDCEHLKRNYIKNNKFEYMSTRIYAYWDDFLDFLKNDIERKKNLKDLDTQLIGWKTIPDLDPSYFLVEFKEINFKGYFYPWNSSIIEGLLEEYYDLSTLDKNSKRLKKEPFKVFTDENKDIVRVWEKKPPDCLVEWWYVNFLAREYNEYIILNEDKSFATGCIKALLWEYNAANNTNFTISDVTNLDYYNNLLDEEEITSLYHYLDMMKAFLFPINK